MTKKEISCAEQAKKLGTEELIRIQKLLTKEINFLSGKKQQYEDGIVMNTTKNELQDEAREKIASLGLDIQFLLELRAKTKVLISLYC